MSEDKVAEAEKLIQYLKNNWRGKELFFEDVDITEDDKGVYVKGNVEAKTVRKSLKQKEGK